MSASNIASLAVAKVVVMVKSLYSAYSDWESQSEQLCHSMSVLNMASLAVAKVVAMVKII